MNAVHVLGVDIARDPVLGHELGIGVAFAAGPGEIEGEGERAGVLHGEYVMGPVAAPAAGHLYFPHRGLTLKCPLEVLPVDALRIFLLGPGVAGGAVGRGKVRRVRQFLHLIVAGGAVELAVDRARVLLPVHVHRTGGAVRKLFGEALLLVAGKAYGLGKRSSPCLVSQEWRQKEGQEGKKNCGKTCPSRFPHPTGESLFERNQRRRFH